MAEQKDLMEVESTGVGIVVRTETSAVGELVPSSPFSGGAEEFDMGQRMAKALASADNLPQGYKGNIPNVLVAIELASRMNVSPIAIMQNMDLIHGRPSLRASFKIGRVNASGRFSAVRYEWRGEPNTPAWGCRAVATELATGETLQGPWVTWETVEREGWTKKAGSKWLSFPEKMFMYRAGSWWVDVLAPELALGMMTRDEVIDAHFTPTSSEARFRERGL